MHPVAEAELEGAREAIATLCRRYGVQRLWIFGSANGPEFDPARSDYDFLAEFGERPEGMGSLRQIVGFQDDLETRLGRAVDVVEVRGIERKNEFFRRSVERTKREVYASEDGLITR